MAYWRQTRSAGRRATVKRRNPEPSGLRPLLSSESLEKCFTGSSILPVVLLLQYYGSISPWVLTAVGRVGRRSVQETRRRRHSEVRHAGISVAVHAAADGVAIVTLLGGGAWDVSPRRHAAGVPIVAHWKKKML